MGPGPGRVSVRIERVGMRKVLLLYRRMIPSIRLCGHCQLEALAAEGKIEYRAVQGMRLKPSDLLCDVYCGAGTITLTMARHCREAIGIEIVPAAVENAKQNALRNGVGNASFKAGRAEELLPRMVADGLRPDVIVVDPPRKGLDPAVIRAMAEAAPDRLVYVSCNPATLARDAGLLKAEGYLVRKVQPVDMFCWTSGVETVCLFTKAQDDN